MKRIIYLSFFLALLVGQGVVFGQQTSEGPVAFQVMTADASGKIDPAKTITFYIESHGISGADGILIGQKEDNPRQALIKYLQGVKGQPGVRKFELNSEKNQLVISVEDLSSTEVESLLRAQFPKAASHR